MLQCILQQVSGERRKVFESIAKKIGKLQKFNQSKATSASGDSGSSDNFWTFFSQYLTTDVHQQENKFKL